MSVNTGAAGVNTGLAGRGPGHGRRRRQPGEAAHVRQQRRRALLAAAMDQRLERGMQAVRTLSTLGRAARRVIREGLEACEALVASQRGSSSLPS